MKTNSQKEQHEAMRKRYSKLGKVNRCLEYMKVKDR